MSVYSALVSTQYCTKHREMIRKNGWNSGKFIEHKFEKKPILAYSLCSFLLTRKQVIMGAYLYIVILFPSLRRLKEVGLKFQASFKSRQYMMRLSQKHRGWGYSSSVCKVCCMQSSRFSPQYRGKKRYTYILMPGLRYCKHT